MLPFNSSEKLQPPNWESALLNQYTFALGTRSVDMTLICLLPIEDDSGIDLVHVLQGLILEFQQAQQPGAPVPTLNSFLERLHVVAYLIHLQKTGQTTHLNTSRARRTYDMLKNMLTPKQPPVPATPENAGPVPTPAVEDKAE